MQLINKINNMKKNMLWGVFGFFMLFLSITAAMTGTINLSIDEAELIKFEMPISELFIANPDVADVQLSSPKAAYLFGKGIGITKLIAMDAKGAEVFKATVNVSQNLGQLRELISYYDPHELVEIKSVPGEFF
jgi:pilus assembly protein CpaC